MIFIEEAGKDATNAIIFLDQIMVQLNKYDKEDDKGEVENEESDALPPNKEVQSVEASMSQGTLPGAPEATPAGGTAAKAATICVCVNSTSRGGRSLATLAYQGRLALVFLTLGAAITKIRSATLTLPSTQGRPFTHLHPTSLEGIVQLTLSPVPSFSPPLYP